MSALLCLCSATSKTNQFVRPRSPFEVVSTAQRLTLRGQGFVASLEYVKAISQGLMDEYVLMAVMSDVKVLSAEDNGALLDLYIGAESAQKVSS